MSATENLVPFEAARLPELIDLWVASWSLTLPQIDFDARRDWFLGHLETLHANGARTILAVAPESGVALGFITLDVARGVINQLCVAPQAQGTGIADRLMAQGRELCPLGLDLEVNEDNPRARGFYARQGFVKVGEGINELSGLRTLMLRWSPTQRP